MRWFALALVGCSEADTVCRDDFTLAEDGHCYADDPPAIEDALRGLPECEPVGGDGAIDLTYGCASGACAWMTASQITEALEEEPACTTTNSDDQKVVCAWTGLDGVFADVDENDVPDSDATTDRIHLYPPYAGGTSFGIGIEANPRCFVDELGLPTWVAYRLVGGELLVQDLVYEHWGLWAYDWGRHDGTNLPNGYIDEIYLYGVP